MDAIHKAGYSNPMLTGQRLFYCYASVTLAALLAKTLIPSSDLKSHFAFGGGAGTVATLTWENEHPEGWSKNGSEKRQKLKIKGLCALFMTISLTSGKLSTRLFAEGISYKGMIGRGFYFATCSSAIAYASDSYRRHQERIQGL
jgi:hypothetical protein